MNVLSNILELLNTSQKIKMILIFILMFFLIFLEVLSIGLIIPIATIFTSFDAILENEIAFSIFTLIGSPSEIVFFLYSISLFFLVIIFKSLFSVFIIWQQSKFSFDLMKYISKILFDKYLNNSWEFHLTNNSSILLRNVTDESSLVTNTVIMSLIIFLNQIFLMIGIFLFLIYFEPFGTAIVFIVLCIVAWIYQRATKSVLTRWGQLRQDMYGERNKAVMQGLEGIKEIKILSKESFFVKLFDKPNKLAADIQTKLHTLSIIPKNMLELIAVFGLLILTLFFVYQDRSLQTLLPILAVFAAAAFRLLPAMNLLLSSLQSIRYAYPSVNILKKDLKEESEIKKEEKSGNEVIFQNQIVIDNLNFHYPNTKRASLKSINLKIDINKAVGIIGESGAGKSTLVDIILGLLTPSNGKVLVDGVDIEENIKSWQKQIGYVPQNIYLLDDTIKKNIALGIKEEEIDKNRLSFAIKSAQLESFVDQLPDGIDTNVGEKGVKLSGGQRQRIGIARALYNKPNILILDEFTSSLDIETEEKVMKSISYIKGKITVIIISHRPSIINQCDQVFKISNGEIK